MFWFFSRRQGLLCSQSGLRGSLFRYRPKLCCMTVFSRTLWISGAIFVAVHLLLAWTVLRARRTGKAVADTSHRGLEIGWSVATAVLFLTLAGLGSRGWARMPGSPAGKEIIEVYSHQFAWNFRYPGTDRRFGRTESARRLLRLTGESAEILKRRMSEPGPFIFPFPKNPARHRGLTWRTHETVLEAMKGRPGACVFVPYDLRHTAATRWATDGMPVPVLAATLGHANLRSVMKYIHITADNIEREVVRIEKIRLSRAGEGSEPISSFDQAGKERRTLPAESGGTSSTTDPCFGSGDSAADLRHYVPSAIGRGTK